MVSGLSWYIVVLVSLLAPLNIVVQTIWIYAEGKSLEILFDNFNTFGLEDWDSFAMFILLYSGSIISPAYLFYLKDSGPQISKFVSLFCTQLNKLIVPGDPYKY